MKHHTASTYIFDNDKVLLIHHKKIRKWFGPGGHVDENEMPHEAAIRECLEETGLEVELIHDERVWITPRFNGCSIPRPAFMLLEKIPAWKDQPEHYHIDHIFVARVVNGKLNPNYDETLDMGWFTLEETKELEMFDETRDVLRQLFPSHQASDQTRSFAKHDCALPLPSADAVSASLPAS
ncbi:MAG: hypothetical protein S4CHLAM81_03910 [Chlamydiales bacterium]|nr:hypothetical protein [Chlamydiales bacterium]MCH9635180.1 hypothetical protein [Chlamydiales bacterium]